MRPTRPRHMWIDPRRRPLLGVALGLVLVASSCAWRYAARDDAHDSPDRNTDDEATELPDQGGDDEPKEDGGREAAAETTRGTDTESNASTSVCGVETFALHYYDERARVTKRVDCRRRKVVTINRAPISREKRQRARSAGLPESTWYLLVDPKGARSEFLTEDHLRSIQRAFDVEYLGRDRARNLLIYEFDGGL